MMEMLEAPDPETVRVEVQIDWKSLGVSYFPLLCCLSLNQETQQGQRPLGAPPINRSQSEDSSSRDSESSTSC